MGDTAQSDAEVAVAQNTVEHEGVAVPVARRYVVTVWTEVVMVQDEATPDVYGSILLTNDEREDLDRRLYALEGEDLIAEYSITEFEQPPVLTLDSIISDATEMYDDEMRDEALSIWNKPVSVYRS